MTPTTVLGSPSMRTVRPTMSGSAPKSRVQRPLPRITTGAAPRAWTSSVKRRPSASSVANTSKNPGVTRAA